MSNSESTFASAASRSPYPAPGTRFKGRFSGLASVLQPGLRDKMEAGVAAPKHLLKRVADGIGLGFMGGVIYPKISPANRARRIFDLALISLFRLPSCDVAQRRKPGSDMGVAFFPRLGRDIGRRFLLDPD